MIGRLRLERNTSAAALGLQAAKIKKRRFFTLSKNLRLPSSYWVTLILPGPSTGFCQVFAPSQQVEISKPPLFLCTETDTISGLTPFGSLVTVTCKVDAESTLAPVVVSRIFAFALKETCVRLANVSSATDVLLT